MTADGRLVVDYWEHWNGFEHEAMQAVVDDYNASQDDVFVKMLRVSEIEQKIILATAGGNPPDVVGLWARNVSTYSEKGALTPLSKYVERAGITGDDYIPLLWELCNYRGHTWGLPTTPGSIGLHWNRRLFREAGLDPDVPPKSIAELEAMAEKLTVVELTRDGQTRTLRYTELTAEEQAAKDFRIVQLGFSPAEPGWWKECWGYWFGADMMDGDEVTANSPANVEAQAWHGSFSEKYGVDNMKRFGASFSTSFASPQNPFMDGRVAMVLQGVWLYNFIDRFAPHLDWAAAAFPPSDPDADWAEGGVTFLDCDILAIPAGADLPNEAFDFIRYVQTQKAMEKLCLGQRKFSPLKEYTQDFLDRHPNKHIELFIALANSPSAKSSPEMSVWQEYKNEMAAGSDRIFGGVATAREATAYVEERIQWKLDRALKRWELTGEARAEEWAAWSPPVTETSAGGGL